MGPGEGVHSFSPGGNGSRTFLSKGGDAHNQLGRVHRAQWEDYKKRFIPAEEALMDSVGGHGETLSRVRSGVGDQFAKQSSEHARRMRDRGAPLTGEQSEALQRRSNVREGAATAGALNTTRMGLRDRDLATMQGGLGSLAQSNRGDPRQK